MEENSPLSSLVINTTAPLHNGSLTTRQWVPARRAAFGHKPWGWKGERLLRWRRRQLHKPSSQRRGHATTVQVQVAHRNTYEKRYANSCIIILDCFVVWSELCLHSTQALPKTCQSYIAWCFLVVGCCIQCTGISYNQKPLQSRLHSVPVLVALSGSKRGGTKLLNAVLESLDWEKQKIGQRVASVVYHAGQRRFCEKLTTWTSWDSEPFELSSAPRAHRSIIRPPSVSSINAALDVRLYLQPEGGYCTVSWPGHFAIICKKSSFKILVLGLSRIC